MCIGPFPFEDDSFLLFCRWCCTEEQWVNFIMGYEDHPKPPFPSFSHVLLHECVKHPKELGEFMNWNAAYIQDRREKLAAELGML